MKIKEAKNFLEGRNWINEIGGVRNIVEARENRVLKLGCMSEK